MRDEITVYQYMADCCNPALDGNEVFDFDLQLADAVDRGLVEIYEDRVECLPDELADDINDGLKVYLPR